jgi:multidrug transporter EmrE-like cation transporter
MKPGDFAWLLCGVVLNAAAQLGLKAATRSTGHIEGTMTGVLAASRQLAVSVPFWLALAAYGISVGVWIIGLSRVPVSQAYPVLSLGYVLAAFAASSMLGETLSLTRWAGIAVVICGVWLISRPA